MSAQLSEDSQRLRQISKQAGTVIVVQAGAMSSCMDRIHIMQSQS